MERARRGRVRGRRSVLCSLAFIALASISCLSDAPPAATVHELPGLDPRVGPAREALQIGLVPEQDLFRQVERYKPLGDYLSRTLGVPVHLRMLPSYSRIVDGFETAGLDGAFMGSFAYLVARERLGVIPVARPVGLDGQSTYRGLIFARRDSGIREFEQMRGKRFVFVDRTTTAGFLLPVHYFRRNGIDDYTTLLAESYFAGTHEDAILDVLNGAADIGAAKNTIYEQLSVRMPRITDELTIIDTSPDVPDNALAVRPDLDPQIRAALEAALLGLHDDPAAAAVLEGMRIQRFIRTTDDDYVVLYRYAREAGLKL